MKFKMIFVLSLGFSLVGPSIALGVGTATNDEQWISSGVKNPNYVGFWKETSTEMRGSPDSVLINYAAGVFDKGLPVNVCTSASDATCKLTDSQNYYAVLPQCLSLTATDCISGISASIEGRQLEVIQRGIFPKVGKQDFTGDPALNLPSGTTATLVQIPEAAHPGGDLYLIKAKLTGMRNLNSQGGAFVTSDFNVGIYAVGLKDGTYHEILVNTLIGRNWKAHEAAWGFTPVELQCISRSSTQCALAYPLPENVNFNLKFRLLDSSLSWLQGRFRNPQVSISRDGAGITDLAVSAQPIRVPIMQAFTDVKNLTSDMTLGELLPAGSWFAADDKGSGAGNMTQFLAWLPYAGDKATALPSSWYFRSSWDQASPNIQSCMAKDVSASTNDSLGTFRGLVTSNASQFLEGPPTFNKQEETLDYKVAAPHLDPIGNVFKGTYDLVISSRFARCLYGFSKAPITATISVTSETGESDVATTVVGERDGLMYLSANGFTFSSPTIRVKLTQEKPAPTPTITPAPTPTITPAPTPTITPAPTPAPSETSTPATSASPTRVAVSSPSKKPTPIAKVVKKTTITCIKVKEVRKVTGVKPTCPAGFKKKVT